MPPAATPAPSTPSVLDTAIESSRRPYGPQRLAWLKRRSERKTRDDERRRLEEERLANELELQKRQEVLLLTPRLTCAQTAVSATPRLLMEFFTFVLFVLFTLVYLFIDVHDCFRSHQTPA